MELISKHRRELLAIGMIWVGLYHAYIGFNNKLINFVLVTCGYGGVDIFVFLAGFGLYFAYKKNNNYLHFIKRRILKMFPYNLVVLSLLFIFKQRGLFDTVIDILGLSIYLRGGLAYWYSSFMLTIYLLTPPFIKSFNKNPLVVTLTTIVFVFVLCLIVNNSRFTYIWFRSAVYVLGIYFAYMPDNNKKIHEWIWILLVIVGWLLMYYLYHNKGNDVAHVYPFIMIIPGTLLVFSWFFEKVKIFNKPLIFLSKYTYPFYLIHNLVVEKFYAYYDQIRPLLPGGDLMYNLYAAIVALLLSIILTSLIELIENNIINKKGTENGTVKQA